MKKISLKELRFGSKEMLTKERIKGLFGGMKEEAIDVLDNGGRSCRIEIIYLGVDWGVLIPLQEVELVHNNLNRLISIYV
ncbi:hypothetical protein [Elizabethkingia anophelis]|uniref:hypothetical protein n=1 Tax=Elizabethkingia anophelis TaxID=1117645 RepID=UPI0021A5AE56|nr:hypothetical protein [Elizabethkingia anophelis]